MAPSRASSGSSDRLHDAFAQSDRGSGAPTVRGLAQIGEAAFQGRAGSYAISTVVNQPQGPSQLAALSSSIGSSIPQSLKPSSLAALAPPSGPTSLAPAHKRSAPPPLQLSEPPKVSHEDVARYLREISAEWARWDKNSAAHPSGLVEGALQNGPLAEAGPSSWSTGHGASPHDRQALPALEDVPTVFFQDDFALADPSTFDIVTERTAVGSLSSAKPKEATLGRGLEGSAALPPLSIPDLATDQILQEKLSYYLDVIELHLVAEISQRSTPFFSALGNLQALHSQTAACLAQVDALQKEMDGMNEAVAKRGLEIVRLQARRQNLIRTELALLRTQEVWVAAAEAEQLAQGAEWEAALDLIESLDGFWRGRRRPLLRFGSGAKSSEIATASLRDPAPESGFDVTKIHALQAIPGRLATLRKSIGRTLEQELVAVLTHELQQQVEMLPEGGQHDKVAAAAFRADVAKSVDGRARPLVLGLARAGTLDLCARVWRKAVLEQVEKAIIDDLPADARADAQRIFDESEAKPSPVGRAASPRPSMAVKSIQDLSHLAFQAVCRRTFARLSTLIAVAETHADSISTFARAAPNVGDQNSAAPPDTTEGPVRPEATPTKDGKPLDIDLLAQDLADVPPAAAELANVRFSKVLTLRADVHTRMTLEEFVALFDLTWSFVIACEVASHRMILGLRGAIMAQAKSFLQAFHQAKVTEGARLVEQEQWAQCDVSPELQRTVDSIVASAVEDPLDFGIVPAAAASPSAGAISAKKQVDIEGVPFFAVSAGLRTLSTLAEYLRLVVNCPLLATDAMSKIVEFLKAFNSRTCQVVLGAGAMRSAGLKNITAKHLALASQAVSIMINLIPYVRECLRRHLHHKQAVMLVDFDKLKRDFQEHQNEIHAKLVSIMGDRLAAHVKSLQSIEWAAVQPSDAGSPSSYAEGLTKEVATLHKVLSRYLQASTVEIVMMQVFSAINSRLADEYSRINLPSEPAKARLLTDARFVKFKLQELKGFERRAPGGDLDALVEDKPLDIAPEPPVAPEPEPSQPTVSKATPKATPPAVSDTATAPPGAEGPDEVPEAALSRLEGPTPDAIPDSQASAEDVSATLPGPPQETATSEVPEATALGSPGGPAELDNRPPIQEEGLASPRADDDLPPLPLGERIPSSPSPTTNGSIVEVSTVKPSPLTDRVTDPVADALEAASATPVRPISPSSEEGPPRASNDSIVRTSDDVAHLPKLSLAQRLSALAASSRDAVAAPLRQSPVLPSSGFPPAAAPAVSEERRGSLQSPGPGRQSLKERLAAIASRAPPSSTQSPRIPSEHPVTAEDGLATPQLLEGNGVPDAGSQSPTIISVTQTLAADPAQEIPTSPKTSLHLDSPRRDSLPLSPARFQNGFGFPDDALRSPTPSQRSLPSSPGPVVAPIADIPLPASSPTAGEMTYAVYKRKMLPRTSSEHAG